MNPQTLSGWMPESLSSFTPLLPPFGSGWLASATDADEPLAARSAAHDQAPLKVRKLAGAGQQTEAPAWVLSRPDVAVSEGRPVVVFVEWATPTAAAPVHGQWLSWQRQAVQAGHPTYVVVLRDASAASPESEAACRSLNACLKDAKRAQASVVLRFDAAAPMLPCLFRSPERVSETVLGPLPLWPLPSPQKGLHPLSALHSAWGWLDNGSVSQASKVVWQWLSHPVTGTLAPGLVQAAVWQEQLVRASLPAEPAVHQLAAAMGVWLVPGMTSVLSDDWALRRVTAQQVELPWPVRAVFAAEDAEPARAWAMDYVRGLFDTWGPGCKLVLGAGAALPLTTPKAAVPVGPKVATTVAKKASAKPESKRASKAVSVPPATAAPVLAKAAAPAVAKGPVKVTMKASVKSAAKGAVTGTVKAAVKPVVKPAVNPAVKPAPVKAAAAKVQTVKAATVKPVIVKPAAVKPTAVNPVAVTPVAVMPVASAPKVAAPARFDDLKIIEGIGPQIARLLNEDGITTFEGLASAPVERLQKVLTAAGPRFALANPGTWPQQASLLAKGDQAAFEALTQRLRAGVAV